MSHFMFGVTAYFIYPLLLAAAGILARTTLAAVWTMLLLTLIVALPAYFGAHARRRGGRPWPWLGKIFLLPLLLTTALTIAPGAGQPVAPSWGAQEEAFRPGGISDRWGFLLLGLSALSFGWAWHLAGKAARFERR